MEPAHVISELAELRDQFTIEQLLDMVVEGLGGKDVVAEALGEDLQAEPDDAEGRDLTVMRDADVARLENIQGMAESFCTWLHAKGAQQMEKDDDEAVDRVRQLSTSFNKAARAVRLSMVLKHEVAGLRPLPNVRAPAAANQNGPGGQNGPASRGGNTRADSTERREESDAERAERRQEEEDNMGLYVLALLDAFDEDVAAAPQDIQAEAEGQSPAVMLTRIASKIPHPRLDRRIADIHLGRLWDGYAPRNVTKPEALGPPDWETVSRRRWNGDAHRRRRAERAARRQ